MEALGVEGFVGTRRFELLSRLGAGGMGVVYEAIDVERRERVALKTLHTFSGEALVRFKREFRALQGLAHPNLVSLHELFEDRGHWFFTMELVVGLDFLSHVRGDAGPSDDAYAKTEPAGGVLAVADLGTRPTLPLADPVDEARLRGALVQVARGLAALHGSGRVHRDIKPSNIRVASSDGRVVVLDFGLVTDASPVDHSSECDLVGTVAYMAPEQARSQRVGPAADVYSLGVLLYEALSGRLPFSGAPLAILMDKQHGTPAPLEGHLPRELAALSLEMLRADPAARPSLVEVLTRLGSAPDEPNSHPGVPSRDHPFVGRAEELARMREAFDRTQEQGATVVVLRGASGVGKSALVRRFTETLTAGTGALVLSGRCYERESVPYKAIDGVIDALSKQLAQMDRADAAALTPLEAALLAQVFPVLLRVDAFARAPRPRRPPQDPTELRARAFAALREMLVRLVQRRPVVVVIDDLQWADVDSFSLLSALLAPQQRPAILVVATLRTAPEGPAAGGADEALDALGVPPTRLDLGRLPDREARQLAEALLRGMPGGAPDRAGALAAEASGHPLFIDELVRHTAVGSPGDAPVHLGDVLWARVARLEATSRRLMELLAVVGRPVPQEIAAGAMCLEFTEFARRAEILRAENLCRTTGARRSDTIETYHDQIRQAVLARLDLPAQRDWHEHVATALEAAVARGSGALRQSHHERVDTALAASGLADPESLAVHWAGAADAPRAARYALQAATEADTALAFDRAARLYRLALDLQPLEGSAAAALQARLGDALANAGRGAEAAEAYLAGTGSLEPGAGKELLVTDLRRRAAEQLLRAGRIGEGRAALGHALGRFGMRLPASERGALLSLLGHRARLRIRGLGFRPRPASRIPVEQLARIDLCWSAAIGLSLASPVLGADFQTRHLLLALGAGEPYRIARALAVEAGYASIAGGRGRRRTERLLDEARRLAEEVGQPHAIGWSRAAAGLAACLQGQWQHALDLSDEAAQILRETCAGVAWETHGMQMVSLNALGYLGDLAELTHRQRRYLREAEARGDVHAAASLRIGSANLTWLAADDVAGARAAVSAASDQWPHGKGPIQGFFELFAQAQIDLYEGTGETALDRLRPAWGSLRQILRVQNARIEAVFLRGRCALSAAREAAPARRAELLRHAQRDAQAVLHERMAWGTPLAQLLLAGVSHARQDTVAARQHLADAAAGFDVSQMRLHAMVARRLGALLDSPGRLAALDAEIEAQGVKHPARWSEMLLPGLGGGIHRP